jgi:hypothetical protein
MDPESLAPGWQIRCTRCGFADSYGKHGIRLGAWSWKQYTIGRCSSCKQLGFHAIERRPKFGAETEQVSEPAVKRNGG